MRGTTRPCSGWSPRTSNQGQLVRPPRPAEQASPSGACRQLRLEQVRRISRFPLPRRRWNRSRCLVVIEAVEAMAEGRAQRPLKTL